MPTRCSKRYRRISEAGRVKRRGELKTDLIVGCPGFKTPARAVFYQARAGMVGTDHLAYAAINPSGAVATYDVTINIKEAPKPASTTKEQKI